ncbi:MAG: DEAD/DEAH box helicase [Candidatus Diapherotrites archaeon]|nr:DEAD/DEAH box helicase [Candidatus Diapherotrites archaeon]
MPSIDIPSFVLSANGFSAFNPMQQKALDAGLFGTNLVIASPTASGKTIIAELAGLDSILNRGQKTIYLAPLRALASEHYHDFRQKYSKPHRIRFALSTGDIDSSSQYLSQYDMIFATTEKVDSLLRHKADWLSQVGLLVVDEVHLLGSDRGPTLEMVLTQFRHINPKVRIVCLSATIPNADAIAKWLSATLVQSDYRPVPLSEGVYFDRKIRFSDRMEALDNTHRDAVSALVADTLHKKNKQALVFANTRPNAQAAAKKLASITAKSLTDAQRTRLQKASKAILSALEQPTDQCRLLAGLVSEGVAFHHAGLVEKQRRVVESAFKKNLVKVICATPTLCLVPDTSIWTGVSDTPVSSLGTTHSLFALQGENLVTTKPLDVISVPNSKPIIHLESVSGFSVRLTENHSVLVKRAGKEMLIPAGECHLGDKIATAGHLHIEPLPSITINEISRESPFSQVALTSDEFYFVGAMLGDGYSGITESDGKIAFKGTPCIVGRDEEVFDGVRWFCSKYQLPLRERKNAYGVPVIYLSKRNWFRIFLLNCGIKQGVDKRISAKLKQSSLENERALLQGLFDTDGCVQKGRNVSFSNISEKLIADIQFLLLRFGIVSRVRKRPAKSMKIKQVEKTYFTKPCFELTISQKKSIMDFSEKIGFRIKRKQGALNELVETIKSNNHYVECATCDYRIYRDLFGGRSSVHKQWGLEKLRIVQELGTNGPQTSLQLGNKLHFQPYKNEKRLNQHYALITRSKTSGGKEWKLNGIGQKVFENLDRQSASSAQIIGSLCPVCGEKLESKLKGGWRDKDFKGDIFWDSIRRINVEPKEQHPVVYDVVLPDDGTNNHFFVAGGLLVHNSAGVNLPAYRVILQSAYRYGAQGSERISVSEWKQCAGRAGRPKFDEHGEAILLSSSVTETDFLFDHYVQGDLEDIESRLAVQPVLRTHLLAAIANNYVFDLDSLSAFFGKTFYAHQFGSIESLLPDLNDVRNHLQEMGFVQSEGNRFFATLLGKRVSELYLDPVSARQLLDGLAKEITFSPLSYLFLFCNTSEMAPVVTVPKKREIEVFDHLQQSQGELVVQLESALYSDPNLVKKFFSAELLEAWISELPDPQIVEQFNVQPGILRQKLLRCDWLAFCCQELSKLTGQNAHMARVGRLRDRLKYGVREELLVLTQFRGIGRVRARRLWQNNVRSVSNLKEIDSADLARLIGDETAQKVKQQLGQAKAL